jgi:hypothetical protein
MLTHLFAEQSDTAQHGGRPFIGEEQITGKGLKGIAERTAFPFPIDGEVQILAQQQVSVSDRRATYDTATI